MPTEGGRTERGVDRRWEDVKSSDEEVVVEAKEASLREIEWLFVFEGRSGGGGSFEEAL